MINFDLLPLEGEVYKNGGNFRVTISVRRHSHKDSSELTCKKVQADSSKLYTLINLRRIPKFSLIMLRKLKWICSVFYEILTLHFIFDNLAIGYDCISKMQDAFTM